MVGQVEAQSRSTTALKRLEYKMRRNDRAQQNDITTLKRLDRRGRPLGVTEQEFLISGSGMKPQFRLKACPRCGGDLARDKDQYRDYDGCIQCGYVADLAVTNQPTYHLSLARNLPRSETTSVPRTMNRLVAITIIASILAVWALLYLLVWMFHVTLGRLRWLPTIKKQ